MAATTLVTFLLYVEGPTLLFVADRVKSETPCHVASVHLYGSWDNFSRCYSLQRDPKLGKGRWRGCHSFTDIICDGDDVHPYRKRNGGLLEGGRYWYYVGVPLSGAELAPDAPQYQLDGDVEIHDASQPSTTACPFLPGQVVNLLEVPTRHPPGPDGCNRERSASVSSARYTLDPDDKYRALRPPELQKPVVDLEDAVDQCFCEPRPSTPAPRSDTVTPPHSCTASAVLSRAATAVHSPAVTTNPFTKDRPALLCSRPLTAAGPSPHLSSWSLGETPRPYTTGMLPDYWDERDLPVDGYEGGQTGLALEEYFLQDDLGNAAAVMGTNGHAALLSCTRAQELSRTRAQDQMVDPELSTIESVSAISSPGARATPHSLSVSSNRTSGLFSSVASVSELDDRDPFVARRRSQPLTPTTRAEFGDVLVTTTWASPGPGRPRSPGRVDREAVPVYGLPEAANASALTLHNLETATVTSPSERSVGMHGAGRHLMVEAWNDGSQHRKTGLQQLVDDLGYLGALIG